MKKLLAISLAVVMMFALALPILAEETAAPFKIGDTPYDDLAAALTAAEAGQTITMTKDYTEAHGSTQNKFLINKNITIDGGAHKLTITCNANIFPFVVKEGAKFTLKNITYFSNGGGIDVQNGDLTLKDVDLSSIGRAAFKPNGTANIVLDNSHAYIPANGGASETVVIFAGTKGTVTLKNGSTITKANNSNGAVNAAASVMYFNGTGTHTFTMESGTKVINAAPAGTAKLSIFGINGACTLNINIAEGAYTQFDTAIANPVVDFIYGRADANVVLNVHDNAFLVKNGVAASVNPYQSGYNTSGMICTYDALTTSAVEGYTAYKLNTNGTVEENFEYTAADGSTKKAGSLKVAVTAAKEDSTVKLLKDLTISESGIAIAKKVTLDLNNKTLAMTAGAYSFTPVTAAFTVKNGTLKMNGGIIVNGNGILNLENVTGVQTMTGTWARPFVKLSGAGTTKLYMDNSSMESLGSNSGNEALILVEHATDGFIYMTNNSWLKTNQASSGSNGQGAISVQTSEETTDLELNVGAGCSIIDAHQTATKEGVTVGAIVDQSKGNIVINLDEGANVKFDYDPGTATLYFVNPKTTDGTVTVNDKGANWIVSAAAAKKGVNLPESFLGYNLGETALEGTFYQDAEATAEVTLKANLVDLAMVDGAAVRTTMPIGLRFTATLSKEVYNALLAKDANATFGFAFALGRYSNVSFAEDYVMMEAGKLIVAEDSDTVTFYKTLTIDETSELLNKEDKSNFRKEIAARAYIKLTIGEGEEAEEIIIWCDYDPDVNKRSIFNVAKAYYEDATQVGATENQVIRYILKTGGYTF